MIEDYLIGKFDRGSVNEKSKRVFDSSSIVDLRKIFIINKICHPRDETTEDRRKTRDTPMWSDASTALDVCPKTRPSSVSK